jgi:uncharacterized membrane protein SpoIIM required for sporulation
MSVALPQFVAERRATWRALDDCLRHFRRGRLTPEEVEQLETLYRRCSADLAHARVHFAGTEVSLFLNQLVARAYAQVYGARPARWNALRQFYAVSFPGAFWAERRLFLAAWAVLLGAGWLGAMGALWHPELANALVPLPLRQHIAEGRMWTDSILEVMPPALLSAKVLTNNLGVALGTFVGGLLGGLGTVVSLAVNGLELGAVTALCLRRGMAPDFFSFVCAHGLVELSVVALAGQAGLVLASGLLAPGRQSRAEALRIRGRTGVQIVLGGTPILAAIGWVEGFISPGDYFSGPVRATVGLGLAALLYGYLIRFGRRALRLNARRG